MLVPSQRKRHPRSPEAGSRAEEKGYRARAAVVDKGRERLSRAPFIGSKTETVVVKEKGHCIYSLACVFTSIERSHVISIAREQYKTTSERGEMVREPTSHILALRRYWKRSECLSKEYISSFRETR